ncbi:hypothetical protein QQ045_009161 [Rhodiola kirilowii]
MLGYIKHFVPKIENLNNANLIKAGQNEVQMFDSRKDMPRRTRDESMHDVPSPSSSSGGEDTFLLDVSHILDLGPIDRTLLYKQSTHRSTCIWETSCTNLLTVRHRGISWQSSASAREESTTVRCTWFRDHMQTVPADATELDIQRYARAYILLMLGSSLLPDSSGSEISLYYLPLRADLDSLSCYSWGATVSAYIYRSLCITCESKHTQLTRCAILLQLWAWEHLTIGRPRKLAVSALPPGADVDPMLRPTLGYKWNVHKSYLHTSHQVLKLLRDLLDRQKANDVIWTPFTYEILDTLNPMCVAGIDSWKAEVPLICFHIAEWDYPSYLDVDVESIHIDSDSDEDIQLPQATGEVGPSQVTQAESQRISVRRASTRIRKITQPFTPL